MRFLLRAPFILAILFAVDILCGGFFVYKYAEAMGSAKEALGDAIFFESSFPTPETVRWFTFLNFTAVIFALLAIISVVRFLRWNSHEFFDSPAPRRHASKPLQGRISD